MKNVGAIRAKILFFIVKYANLWGFCCRRRRGCLSSLLFFNNMTSSVWLIIDPFSLFVLFCTLVRDSLLVCKLCSGYPGIEIWNGKKNGIGRFQSWIEKKENLLLSAYLVQTTSKQLLRVADWTKMAVKCTEKKEEKTARAKRANYCF